MVRHNRQIFLTAGLTWAAWLATGLPAIAQVLYVADAANQIVRFDAATGAPLGNFSLPAPVGGVIIGPNGNLFAGQFNTVLELNPHTGTLIRTITPGNRPSGMAFASDGTLLIASYHDSNVRRVDLANNSSSLFALLFEGHHVAVTGNGNAYVSSFGSETLTRFNPSGASTGSVSLGGWGFGTTVGPDGFIYVALENADRVVRVHPDTLAVSTFISAGLGGLDGPRDVRFGHDGNLYVLSGWNDSVKKYDGLTGAYLTDFVTAGAGGITDSHFFTFGPVTVPEPSTLLSAGTVSAGIALAYRRRRMQRPSTGHGLSDSPP